MKLWFVIAFLVTLKDFCQQVPTPSSPGGLKQKNLVGGWDAFESSNSAGNIQHLFCSEAAKGSTSKIP